MNTEHRELVEKRTDADARFVVSILRRREAGLTRQRTTAEIAAMYCVEHKAWKCTAH